MGRGEREMSFITMYHPKSKSRTWISFKANDLVFLQEEMGTYYDRSFCGNDALRFQFENSACKAKVPIPIVLIVIPRLFTL